MTFLCFFYATPGLGLTADLATHTVRIDTDFTGEEIVVFGNVDKKADVIVVVRGPEETLIIRKKQSIHGLWLNQDSLTVHEVPRFYAMACTRALDTLLSPEERTRHEIGLHNLHLTWSTSDRIQQGLYTEALLKEKSKQGHYVPTCGSVNFVSPNLFRVTFQLPATVPTGAYTVQIFLAQAGHIIDARTIPFIITKAGTSAELSEFATHNGFVYGLLSALLSFLLGLVISQFFSHFRV